MKREELLRSMAYNTELACNEYWRAHKDDKESEECCPICEAWYAGFEYAKSVIGQNTQEQTNNQVRNESEDYYQYLVRKYVGKKVKFTRGYPAVTASDITGEILIPSRIIEEEGVVTSISMGDTNCGIPSAAVSLGNILLRVKISDLILI